MTYISDKYATLGGPAGLLGPPVGGEVPAAGGGVKQQFRNGAIYWHARTGAFEAHGSILAHWQALGAEGSWLGYPTSDETNALDGQGRFNTFEHASVYWHSSTGAWEVHGLIRDRWRALGGEVSLLGFPTTDETSTPDGVGRFNHFQRGSIYWTPVTGANEIYGPARSRWAELRWERGLLGYPIAPPQLVTRNRVQYLTWTFQNGKIEVNTSTADVYVEKTSSPASPNYAIPIVAYRVSDDDGSRKCAITADDVQQWITHANLVFAAAGVHFTYDGVLRDLADTEVNRLRGEEDPNWIPARNRLNALAAQHRSVVVVHRAEIGGGFSWSTYDFVAMSFFDSVDPHALWLLAHELGHHFGLPHTFGPTFQTIQQAEDYLLSGQASSGFDGDSGFVDDTPGDPFIGDLQRATSINAVVLGGRAFSLARGNVMSYWGFQDTARLSHSQIDRVRQVVVERQARYLDVSSASIAICPQLIARREALLQRQAQLVADVAAETDLLSQRRLRVALARVTAQLSLATTQAQTHGCL